MVLRRLDTPRDDRATFVHLVSNAFSPPTAAPPRSIRWPRIVYGGARRGTQPPYSRAGRPQLAPAKPRRRNGVLDQRDDSVSLAALAWAL